MYLITLSKLTNVFILKQQNKKGVGLELKPHSPSSMCLIVKMCLIVTNVKGFIALFLGCALHPYCLTVSQHDTFLSKHFQAILSTF